MIGCDMLQCDMIVIIDTMKKDNNTHYCYGRECYFFT